MVVAILAVVWALVLVPPWVRRRADERPSASIRAFRRQLDGLARTLPAHAGGDDLTASSRRAHRRRWAVRSPKQARRRRRAILRTLVALDVAAAVLVTEGLGLWAACLLGVGVTATAAFVALLVHSQRLAAERQRKVRTLPRPAASFGEPALRRIAAR